MEKKTVFRPSLNITMDESLTELLARLREEWKEKISTDAEATKVEIAS